MGKFYLHVKKCQVVFDLTHYFINVSHAYAIMTETLYMSSKYECMSFKKPTGIFLNLVG